MSAYALDDERAMHTGQLVQDWARSGLLSETQREAAAADCQVDLRRTNRFLRITLLLFGLLILLSVIGVMAISLDVDESGAAVLCGAAAAASFWFAGLLVARYRLYRFGIEEAAALVSILLAGVAAALFTGEVIDLSGDAPVLTGLAVSSAVAVAVFRRFGYLYAALIAMALAAAIPFVPGDSDTWHRVLSAATLAVMFATARAARGGDGAEPPAPAFAVIEAAAWAGIYLVTNLKISSWLSSPLDRTAFYWATYAGTWLLPAAGLWLAVRERHRALLDVSAVLAIITLTTNKPYLGAEQKPWDPIVFGVVLIGIAMALRRWLARGADGARAGFVAGRLLASEQDRLDFAATVSVVHQGPVNEPALHSDAPGGGGRSGGAGATGRF